MLREVIKGKLNRVIGTKMLKPLNFGGNGIKMTSYDRFTKYKLGSDISGSNFSCECTAFCIST